MVRIIGFGILGMIIGAALGGAAGLGGGIVAAKLAGIPDIEGMSGYVAVYGMAGGVIVGAIGGLAFAVWYARWRRG
jgi:hypothetical protein